jgi:hypothetical protein
MLNDQIVLFARSDLSRLPHDLSPLSIRRVDVPGTAFHPECQSFDGSTSDRFGDPLKQEAFQPEEGRYRVSN